MIARLLYTAVVLCVIGALPRGVSHRAPEGASRPAAAPIEPSAWRRAAAARYCEAGDRDGIGRNPLDFAIPRIDR